MDTYQKKIARAIKLLQFIPQVGAIEVSYSGGKGLARKKQIDMNNQLSLF